MLKREEKPLRILWRIIYPSLTFCAVSTLGSVLFLLGILAYLYIQGMTDAETAITLWTEMFSRNSCLLTIGVALVSIPLMLWFMHWDKARKGGVTRYCRVSAIYYVMALFLGACVSMTVNNLMSLSGLMEIYTKALEEIGAALYQGNIWMELMGIGLIAPVAEEMVFRALTMGRMREHLGAFLSIFLSSVIFAACHGNLIQGIYAFILGLLLGYAYEKYHHLLAPIAIHAGANVMSVLVSETGCMDVLYQNTTICLGGTAIFAAISVAMIGVIQYRVDPSFGIS